MQKYGEIIHTLSPATKENALPNEFSLLCWNVQKQNLGYRFHSYFEELLRYCAIDMIALQEVKIHPSHSHSFYGFDFSFAPNVKFLDHYYGVLNGSRIKAKSAFSLLTTHQESVIQTHKCTIFSYFQLEKGETLLLVNLHAINFRRTAIYIKEIEAILEKARHHQGAMIVTGDFNSWNLQRMNVIKKWTGLLHLISADIPNSHLIKSFMTHKLDHIFYRGLRLKESRVIDVKKISDHNALYARFESL